MTATRVLVREDFRWLIGREGGWQFGEQGVLDAIVQSLPDIPRTCIEFGAGDGKELPVTVGRLIDAGWKATLFEPDPVSFAALGEVYPYRNGDVGLRLDTIRPENIEAVDGAFAECGVCVIDVDGNEYAILAAMKSKPVVVVVEHWDECDQSNPRAAAVPKSVGEFSPGGFIYQANAPAVAQLMADRGYELVWANRINGIYVRDDCAGKVSREPKRADSGKELRLYLGSDPVKVDGFTKVARADAYPLPYADNSVDEIRAVNTLEMFGIDQTASVLADWVRALKPGSRVRISVPDVVKLAQEVLDPKIGFDVTRGIYGTQNDSGDCRKSGFDDAGLIVAMQRAGLIAIAPWHDDIQDSNQHPASLNFEGYKPTEKIRNAGRFRNIKAVQSMPRLGFTDTMTAMLDLVRSLGISVTTQQGVFWGQCLERGMTKAAEEGAEWILTIDYDTVFSVADVQKLAMLMEANPDVGAICPLQLKRDDDVPILNVDGENKRSDLSALRGPLLDVTHAHFGCTLIRVSALAKMPHPWFMPKPAPDGNWGDDRVDEDIAFWHKFRECGNRLCIAPRVCVGHSQLMITWPDERLRPVRQHTKDWRENGPHPLRRC